MRLKDSFLLLCVLLTIVGCSDSPDSIVRKYLSEKWWENKLQYVKTPDAVKPLMEKFYDRYGYFESKPSKVTLDNRQNLKLGETAAVTVVFEAKKDEPESENVYIVERTTNGLKIDWECSVGYNSLTWIEFLFHKPEEPIQFRVLAKIDPRFPDEKVKGKDYWHFYLATRNPGSGQLESKGIEHEAIRAFVEKDSELGKQLYEVMKDLTLHYLTLKIRYVPDFNKVSKHSSKWDYGLLVTEVVTEGWCTP